MITLEKVEALRSRTNAGFAEAKAALEEADGDLEAAVALLEKQKQSPNGGSRPSSAKAEPDAEPTSEAQTQERWGAQSEARAEQGRKGGSGVHAPDVMSFFFQVARFFVNLIRLGNRNHFEIWRNGAPFLSVPVTVLVLFMIPFFWAIVPCLFLGLFCGFSYRFFGPDFGRFS